ncbi:MAG: cation:proton antiporter, partial [Gammaproteobacteria bacterium]|nr:cation:proton antiporter [Gammaproteobacteria bacterium]
MLIILGLLGGEGVEPSTLLRQACGTLGIFLLVFWSLRRGGFSLPVLERVKADKELQVFVALLLCFSLAFVTGILHLSTALGSFVAGILIGQTRDAEWVRSQLDAVKVIFVALFFGSVGILIDFHFLLENWNGILILVAIVFIGNTVINAAILRVLGDPPGECLYGGALLAHVGEFSFVLAAIGFNAAIVTDVGYQLTITVIAVSLVLGPAWVSLIRLIGNRLGLQHA